VFARSLVNSKQSLARALLHVRLHEVVLCAVAGPGCDSRVVVDAAGEDWSRWESGVADLIGVGDAYEDGYGGDGG